MTQTAAPKKTAADKRFDFIREVTAPLENVSKARLTLRQAGLDEDLVPILTVDELREIAKRMRDEGADLGRTDRWKKACRFAASEMDDCVAQSNDLSYEQAHWAVLQGSVFMAHAAE